MKGIYKYLLIYIIGFFFILSAGEVNTRYFTNTFDDEYDYYLPANDPNILPVIFFSLSFDSIPYSSECTLQNTNKLYSAKAFIFDNQPETATKLFLKNSLLRI